MCLRAAANANHSYSCHESISSHDSIGRDVCVLSNLRANTQLCVLYSQSCVYTVCACAGHCPHDEAAEEVSAAMARFMAKHTGTEPDNFTLAGSKQAAEARDAQAAHSNQAAMSAAATAAAA